jgi:hypothetical protein
MAQKKSARRRGSVTSPEASSHFEVGGQTLIPALVWDALRIPCALLSQVCTDEHGNSISQRLGRAKWLDSEGVQQAVPCSNRNKVMQNRNHRRERGSQSKALISPALTGPILFVQLPMKLDLRGARKEGSNGSGEKGKRWSQSPPSRGRVELGLNLCSVSDQLVSSATQLISCADRASLCCRA